MNARNEVSDVVYVDGIVFESTKSAESAADAVVAATAAAAVAATAPRATAEARSNRRGRNKDGSWNARIMAMSGNKRRKWGSSNGLNPEEITDLMAADNRAADRQAAEAGPPRKKIHVAGSSVEKMTLVFERDKLMQQIRRLENNNRRLAASAVVDYETIYDLKREVSQLTKQQKSSSAAACPAPRRVPVPTLSELEVLRGELEGLRAELNASEERVAELNAASDAIADFTLGIANRIMASRSNCGQDPC